MMTLAVAPVGVSRRDGLLRIQRLDGDERLVQKRPRRREKIVVVTSDGGEFDGGGGRYHGATCFTDPVAERYRLFFSKRRARIAEVIEDNHPGSPRSS